MRAYDDGTNPLAARSFEERPPRVGASGRWAWRAIAPAVLVLLVFGCGPRIWPLDPQEQHLEVRLQRPSRTHPFGTDQLGRDVLARVLEGGRLSLTLAAAATLVSSSVGVAVGVVATATPYPLRVLLRRGMDAFLAFPWLVLAITVAALAGGRSRGVILALGLTGWITYARLAESTCAALRNAPFVEAAQALGAGAGRIYLRHIFPHVFPLVATLAIVRYPHVIGAIGTLSFLGVGLQPPQPEWGAMLQEGMPYFLAAPHLLVAPVSAVTVACLAVTFAGEALRKAMNPRLR